MSQNTFDFLRLNLGTYSTYSMHATDSCVQLGLYNGFLFLGGIGMDEARSLGSYGGEEGVQNVVKASGPNGRVIEGCVDGILGPLPSNHIPRSPSKVTHCCQQVSSLKHYSNQIAFTWSTPYFGRHVCGQPAMHIHTCNVPCHAYVSPPLLQHL